MKLSLPEFNAMQSPARRWLQRWYEFPIFRRMGLQAKDARILEIGCGSGYGAQLLSTLQPASYLGIDLMPEQIALAQKRQLPNAEFRVGDAADLSALPDGSMDVVVIFGALHHIPEWRQVVRECARVLRPGGTLYNDEPDGKSLLFWDRYFHWKHPGQPYLLSEFETEMSARGFKILHKAYRFGFGFYAAQKARVN